jgi:hypothetical protein
VILDLSPAFSPDELSCHSVAYTLQARSKLRIIIALLDRISMRLYWMEMAGLSLYLR